MNFERDTRENPYKILLSILALSGILFTFGLIKGDPEKRSYKYLANLKSLTEEKVLFSSGDPVPSAMIFLWKKTTSLNYISAFRTLSFLLFSIFLHLLMRLFVRNEWSINHYGGIYLAAFLPYINLIPEIYFEELVTSIFLLLIFLSFKFQSIFDLLMFLFLSLISFFSNFLTFLFGYSIFVIKAGTLGIRAQRAKTTVFYKRKNIPKLILFVYLTVFFLSVVLLSSFHFFGEHSFIFFLNSLLDHFLYFGLLILFIFLIQYLLQSEKELKSPVSTGVIILLITISAVYGYKKSKENKSDDFISQKTEILTLRGRGTISKGENIYGEKELADYAYFTSGEKIQFLNFELMKSTDIMVVNGMWAADRVQMDKLFRSRRPLYYTLTPTSVLMRKELIEKILQSKEDSQIRNKLLKFLHQSQKKTPYDKFRNFLGSLIYL